MSPFFFQTQTGQGFYEATMPALVRELARLNKNLDRLLALVESKPEQPKPSVPEAP